MSKDKRARIKGRRESGSFLRLPHDWICSREFRLLSPRANKAFTDLAGQYRGNNNGALSLPRGSQKDFGWSSHHALKSALDELEEKGWIIKTRQGDKNTASLFALTIWAVDECDGKHWYPPSKVPAHLWRTKNSMGRIVPAHGSNQPLSGTDEHRQAA